MRSSNHNHIPITFNQLKCSEKAVLVQVLSPRWFHAPCWMPKSQLGTVSIVTSDVSDVTKDVWTASVPKWLYDSKYDADVAAKKNESKPDANPDEVNDKLAEVSRPKYHPRQYGDNADRDDNVF